MDGFITFNYFIISKIIGIIYYFRYIFSKKYIDNNINEKISKSEQYYMNYNLYLFEEYYCSKCKNNKLVFDIYYFVNNMHNYQQNLNNRYYYCSCCGNRVHTYLFNDKFINGGFDNNCIDIKLNELYKKKLRMKKLKKLKTIF